MLRTYKLEWIVYKTDGTKVRSVKPSKVAFCNNELEAKIKLEKRLASIVPNLGSLVVTKCETWNPLDDLVNEIFKK